MELNKNEIQISNVVKVDSAKFFDFRQNNSGGYWIKKPELGIAEFVIIEAFSYKEAAEKMRGIVEGKYDEYCGCCGERWDYTLSEFYTPSGRDVPSIYDTPITLYDSIWRGYTAMIHRIDGSIERFDLKSRRNIVWP